MSDQGHIELERHIDSITIGVRHRRDMGDIETLMRSIQEVGLLQPVTITPDGVLVCGARRLEALRRLGEHTLKVWVRSGISDELSHLLAQQDENTQRKPLSPLEAETLYREVNRLLKEDAQRRKAATQFSTDRQPGAEHGPGHCPGPSGAADARTQAARLVTGDQSYHRLGHIGWLKDIAADPDQIPHVREFAANALKAIDEGAPVDPAYRRVKAAVELASTPKDEEPDAEDDLGRRAAEALERVRRLEKKNRRGLRNSHTPARTYRSLRSFILTWTDLEGWSALYDLNAIAAQLPPEEWERFERVVAETVEFATMLRAARQALVTA
ncbi:MAG: ParB N-terminal domain-containing protein [Solirubrobacteraceae bacterium]